MRFAIARRVILVSILMIFGATGSHATDHYKLENVKRVDQDLYRSGDLYIQTQYCYHYTYGETAILKWDGAYGENKIIWSDDSTCKVKDLLKK